MTTSERIDQLAQAFESRIDLGLNSAGDLWDLIETELGHREILDRPQRVGPLWQQARAPRLIYHVCASNLAVSAETSLLLGLLAGSSLYFKLPGTGLPGFEKSVRSLPTCFRDRVRYSPDHDKAEMKLADAVVVFGSDSTLDEIHRQCRWKQRFLGYGHKISLGVIFDRDLSPSLAAKAAAETLAYEQLGCLSPQAYLCESPAGASQFARLLAGELRNLRGLQPLPERSLEQSALRQDYILRALARGEIVEQGDTYDFAVVSGGLTIALDPFAGHGCIQVISGFQHNELKHLAGKLSAVSFSSVPDSTLAAFFMSLGVSRLCRTGDLQNPPLLWRHDGRPRLADLVTWITFETGDH